MVRARRQVRPRDKVQTGSLSRENMQQVRCPRVARRVIQHLHYFDHSLDRCCR